MAPSATSLTLSHGAVRAVIWFSKAAGMKMSASVFMKVLWSMGFPSANPATPPFSLTCRAKDKGIDLNGVTYKVQGFGNVGSWASRLLAPYGAKLIAVEDHTDTVRNPGGLDPELVVRGGLLAHRVRLEVVSAGFQGEVTGSGELFRLGDVVIGKGGRREFR